MNSAKYINIIKVSSVPFMKVDSYFKFMYVYRQEPLMC